MNSNNNRPQKSKKKFFSRLSEKFFGTNDTTQNKPQIKTDARSSEISNPRAPKKRYGPPKSRKNNEQRNDQRGERRDFNRGSNSNFKRSEPHKGPRRWQSKGFKNYASIAPSQQKNELSEFLQISPDETINSTFEEFNFVEPIQVALKRMAFEKPTPIQAKSIPEVLAGKDLVACAQTGTGKTAAFCLPILTEFIKNPEATGLILAPTRELAQQIGTFWRTLTETMPEYRCVTVTGGSPMDRQIKALAKDYRLIVATPGRLLDHLKRRKCKLDNCSILVLDEADRMLDMGFAPQLAEIEKFVPQKRQNLLFSATWNKNVDQLSKKFLVEPLRIAVGSVSKAAASVKQTFKTTSQLAKNDTLINEIRKREGSIIVFTRTKSRTHKLSRFLTSLGMQVEQMHGDRTQGQRRAALEAFRNGESRILVATDVAARGIDVADIGHVINYDLPQVAEDYIHRIGRSGRAGSTGQALSLIAPEEHDLWEDIMRLLIKTGSATPQQEK